MTELILRNQRLRRGSHPFACGRFVHGCNLRLYRASAKRQCVLLSGNLAVTRSVYVDTGSITAGTTVLPPNCSPANCPTPVTAVTSSAYPYVFNNDTVDGNFGVTSKIFLDQVTPFGWVFSSFEVPNSSQHGVGPKSDQMVTSFSSKSELAVNLSTDGKALTFMGYFAPIGAIDVSNSNTPGEIDPTDAPGNNYYRSVAEVDQHGKFHFTKTNAYTGDNGRAAILNDSQGANLVYMAGNAGNGTQTPQPVGVIISTGAQMLTPTNAAEATPKSRNSHSRGELQHCAVGRQAGQDRKRHQLPRPDDFQQRALLHEGKRQQRHQHRLLCRYHRFGVHRHERRGPSRRRCEPSDVAVGL